MILQAKNQLTLQEFLNLPPGEGDITYELVDGQAILKMSPKFFLAKLTRVLLNLIEQSCEEKGEVCLEWAVALTRRGLDWMPIPDILYISYERLPANWDENEACPVPPDLVIEIISPFGFESDAPNVANAALTQSAETAKTATLSPGQIFGQMAAKAKDYLDAKVLRVWVLDSKARSITVFYPDAAPQTYMGEELLTDSLFEGLQFTVEQVFQKAKIPFTTE
ncbi:Uma2 family endonuclease [Nostoc sp. LPT]|uniref:Uma2 family endonuclease n=1 Tax=Nostoc sp. LPT TaxID=2815387 RepID=UPI001D8BC58F|nr:Uma2 family endonuclease [Nostoc sp. LPT]MBN4001062.1 Uma2 family endonuclease [Nostoc sp. LPT]